MWCRLRTMLHVYCLLQSSYAVCMPKVPHCEMERYQITSYIYFFLHKFFGVLLGLRMLNVHECCEEIQTYLGSFIKKSPLFFLNDCLVTKLITTNQRSSWLKFHENWFNDGFGGLFFCLFSSHLQYKCVVTSAAYLWGNQNILACLKIGILN